MFKEKIAPSDGAAASFIGNNSQIENVEMHGRYVAECFDANGNIKWSEAIENLVTTVGKNDLLDKYLAGSAYTAAIVMGLKGTGTAVVGDTQASHATWLEVGLANVPAYSGTRKTPAFSAAAAGSKATSAAVSFTFTSGGTVAGVFINQGGSATIDNTTGILYSAGDFASARVVVATDVLNVTYTASA
jgi:hypothetical protein